MSSSPRSPRLVPTRRRAFLALACVAVTTAVDIARASDSDAPPARERWYGWQPLVADSAVVGLIAIGVARVNADQTSTSWFLGGIAMYVLAAPAIHALHGRFDTAENDLALRLALPSVGALAGAFIGTVFGPQTCASGFNTSDGGSSGSGGSCPPWLVSGLAVGSAVGAGIAVMIDGVWFAREPVAVVDPARTARRAEPRWMPTASPTRGGATLGILGSF